MHFVRFLVLFVVSLSSVGCTQDGDVNQVAIRTVEATVKMPIGAHPLAAYERYYARRPDGTIVGVYTNHDEDHRRQVLKVCQDLKETPFPCPINGESVRLVQAGEILWLEDPLDLPAKSGGGCALITVEYNPKMKQFGPVECNGPY